MKLTKWQILALVVLIWFYTKGGIGPVTPFVPQLHGADLDAKVLAGMLVLADEAAPSVKPQTTVEPVVEEPVSTPIVFDGRRPRSIILTDLVNCGPCRTYDTVMAKFKSKSFKSRGWDVGTTKDHVIEVVDINKDPDKFQAYFELLAEYDDKIVAVTPTTIFLNKDGTVKEVVTGVIQVNEFIKKATTFDKVAVSNVESSLSTMTYNEMVKLHNKLHGGGIWKWPGNLATHLATIHGVK